MPLIDNTDLARLKRWNTPVIKYHGCVSRPDSMVATSTDIHALEERRPLVEALISGSLASKSLLIVGHGLADEDLTRTLRHLLRDLGEYTPKLYVLRQADSSERIAGFDHPHEVIGEDLTQFLNRLMHEHHQVPGDASFFDEQWLASAFFADLRKAAVLPSETQVIDAFLSHLRDEIGARPDVDAVVDDASAAVRAALSERRNYTALRRTWDEV